jgi:hypothetical protein
MPWRKEWVDPGAWEGGDEELGSVLARRAYEVWVSEVSKLWIVFLWSFYIFLDEGLEFCVTR